MKRIFLPRDFIWFLIPLIPAGFLLFFHFFIFSQTRTERGIKQLEKKQPHSAEKLFLKILEKDPFHPYTHLNLGLSYDRSGRPAQALKEYNMVSKYFKDDLLRFFASFNTAELEGRLGNLDKALESYQKALSFSSFSMEQEKIKQNIELLLKTPPPDKGGGAKKSAKGKDNQQGDKKGEGDSRNTGEEEGDSSSKDDLQAQNSKEGEESSGDGQRENPDSPSRLKPAEEGSLSGDMGAGQAESIMDEIEELESAVRARQFQQNSMRKRARRRRKRPDW